METKDDDEYNSSMIRKLDDGMHPTRVVQGIRIGLDRLHFYHLTIHMSSHDGKD